MRVLRKVRGTVDLLPDACRVHNYIYAVGKQLAELYGYEEIKTPYLESKDTFVRTLGKSSDIVSKEMFEVSNSNAKKEKAAICLRPENTAGIMRAVLENGLQQKLPQRYFYQGPMFRYERPQRGRQRQFTQLGIESIGTFGISADAESIQLAAEFLKQLGFNLQFHAVESLETTLQSPTVELRLNTLGSAECREVYSNYLEEYLNEWMLQNPNNPLSFDTFSRIKEGRVLRVLDSKAPEDQACINGAPSVQDSLSTESRERFHALCELLQQLGISYILDNRLVRGLDYYNHTAFEFTVDNDQTQASRPIALLAGGRYDMLASTMNAKHPIPAIGWAAGVERLVIELDHHHMKTSLGNDPSPVFIVPLLSSPVHDKIVRLRVLECATLLRAAGISSIVSHNQNDRDASATKSKTKSRQSIIRKGIKEAEKAKAQIACFVGEEEAERGAGCASLKNLSNGELFSNLTSSELISKIQALQIG
uniref:histidine--tRNA ligase n=1 Tax=Aplanochytrium stocchinoi TaxID=215587 RepID=A0A7S3V1J5_9STRA